MDLPNETGMMKYYTKSQLGEVQLSSSSFGQAMAVTPLQVCTAISAAVNGGYLVTPHVVDKITDQNGNVIQEIGSNVRRQVISKSASETIRQIMEYEVGDGTTTGGGSNAYVAGYRIGGKSGTSEQLNMERRADGDYKKWPPLRPSCLPTTPKFWSTSCWTTPTTPTPTIRPSWLRLWSATSSVRSPPIWALPPTASTAARTPSRCRTSWARSGAMRRSP